MLLQLDQILLIKCLYLTSDQVTPIIKV